MYEFVNWCSFADTGAVSAIDIAERVPALYRYSAMVFSDLDLSRRLERAEGQTCLEFAEARSRLHPDSGASWIECAGAYAVFDGVDSPVTQSFGLGLFEPLTPGRVGQIEGFFSTAARSWCTR